MRSPRSASPSGRWSSSRPTTLSPRRRTWQRSTRACTRSASGRRTRTWPRSSCGDRVVQVDRKSGQIRDESASCERYGVAPAQIPDYLALVGDSADGYPGIKGIGAVTAASLLQRHGSIEEFPDNVLGAEPGAGAAVQGPRDAANGRAAVRRCRRDCDGAVRRRRWMRCRRASSTTRWRGASSAASSRLARGCGNVGSWLTTSICASTRPPAAPAGSRSHGSFRMRASSAVTRSYRTPRRPTPRSSSWVARTRGAGSCPSSRPIRTWPRWSDSSSRSAPRRWNQLANGTRRSPRRGRRCCKLCNVPRQYAGTRPFQVDRAPSAGCSRRIQRSPARRSTRTSAPPAAASSSRHGRHPTPGNRQAAQTS